MPAVALPYIMAAAAAAGTGAAVYNGQQQRSAAKDAATKAKQAADAQAALADQDMNRRNAKTPDFRGGSPSTSPGTMLTGPSGVDTSSLSLGKKTLLGL